MCYSPTTTLLPRNGGAVTYERDCRHGEHTHIIDGAGVLRFLSIYNTVKQPELLQCST
jgi:hypothetical protein